MANSISVGNPSPGCKKVDPILVADSVTRQFGGLTAVDVQHLEIPRGLITALIGPNGAGKTTMFNLLTGFDKPNSGSWSFDGKDLAGVAPYKVARLGMIRTFQLTKALSLLTVVDNMRLGAQNQPGEGLLQSFLRPIWKKREVEITERADELLQRSPRQPAATFQILRS
jgi:branched-chain amino acid transport system ATP-binding protein